MVVLEPNLLYYKAKEIKLAEKKTVITSFVV